MACVAGLTTFEGIANTLKLATDAAAAPASQGPPQSGRGASAQDPAPAGNISCIDGDRQPEGALETALSRLGGMLESAGPLIDQPCSQLELPAGPPARQRSS